MANSANHDPTRVAAIVLNSVSHDTRVLKEAATLQDAGYEVTIFGIGDNRCNEPRTDLPDGTRIVRCAWRSKQLRWVAYLFLAVGLCGLALLVLAYWLWIESIALWINNMLYWPTVAKVGGLLLIVMIGIGLIRRPVGRLMRMAERYAALDAPQPAEANAAPNKRLSPLPMRLFDAAVSRVTGLFSRVITPLIRQREMLKTIEKFDPQVVHCHDLSALPIGCSYARRHRVAVVYDSHEIYEAVSMMSWHRRRWLEWCQRRCSRHVDLFVTINQSIAEYLTRKYPKLPPAVVVKNAARPLNEPLEYDGRLHEAAGLERSTRVLLYQGGFSRFRGLSILVQSAPLLPSGWVLVMMGWGTLEKELKALAWDVDPEAARIRFIPGAPLAELAQWTAGGTLGVIPYENVCLNHWYCTPNKLWEYPVAGVPILASAFPELRRTIESNGIGRLLPDPLTPQAIADAVASISERELRLMHERCLTFIRQDNWSLYAQRLVDLYDQLSVKPTPRHAGVVSSGVDLRSLHNKAEMEPTGVLRGPKQA